VRSSGTRAALEEAVMEVQALAIVGPVRDVRLASRPAPPIPPPATRLSASLFVPTIDARILAANVRAQTPAMVKRLGVVVVGDDDARTLGAYCAALRILLKGSARVHGLRAPDGTLLHSLRDYVRAYFGVPAADDFKAPGSRGKRIINTISHYSNTYGGADSPRGRRCAQRSPVDALRTYIARTFPKLATVEEARAILEEVTARYEALVRSTMVRKPPAPSSTRSAA
jgi:hypothetical protein